jgi:hypothetical protein
VPGGAGWDEPECLAPQARRPGDRAPFRQVPDVRTGCQVNPSCSPVRCADNGNVLSKAARHVRYPVRSACPLRYDKQVAPAVRQHPGAVTHTEQGDPVQVLQSLQVTGLAGDHLPAIAGVSPIA